MADTDPSSFPLPHFLDPILTYLSSFLPPPLYSFLITLLSHGLALATALFSLFYNLLSSSPTQWDAQIIIPPLISVLAAYLALLSLYRTTSWMFRTGVWFVKWGAILGALFAAVGWAVANGGGDVAQAGLGGGGVISFLSGLVLDAINGRGQNAAGTSRTRTHSQSQPRNARPKLWESFQQHRDWQYQDNADYRNNYDWREDGYETVQGVIGNIVEAAQRGGWLAAAQRAMDGFQNPGPETPGKPPRKQPERKAKAKAKGKSGSR